MTIANEATECFGDLTSLSAALKKFGDTIEKDCRIDDMRLPWCPMLPYVYPKYPFLKKKIFYVGQDTLGWDLRLSDMEEEKLFSFFFECYDNLDFSLYLKRNANALTLDKRINAWPNKPGSFWFGINSLQLKLFLNRDPKRGLRGLTEEELEIINGIGYSNLNSIEFESTLRKQGAWDQIAHEQYFKIKKSSEENLDGVKHILKCFNPDCIVIASWSGKAEEAYFSDCIWKRCEEEEKTLSFIKVQNYLIEYNGRRCKVIWTYHPRSWGGWSWRRFAISVNELASHIKASLI